MQITNTCEQTMTKRNFCIVHSAFTDSFLVLVTATSLLIIHFLFFPMSLLARYIFTPAFSLCFLALYLLLLPFLNPGAAVARVLLCVSSSQIFSLPALFRSYLNSWLAFRVSVLSVRRSPTFHIIQSQRTSQTSLFLT
ncbi:hypothetical protein F5890DRAFT_1215378 [Lentinula detonsa]|uniref:Uncharacterized protein n=1 Tax=Lentinula detonsa TaxID=2804962 RepID=A0AA38USL7_9AGAR|nr:hypothetical protein F5890DRAFT_1215378 [Lentinula detonsa]